ncbi:hypothetical protein LZQ00_08130 [Sphingobacterium sp. SRCM116780]|uniref:hypothetical protein n=1 Tax=Sphingobacterium sp. SRCM116780 TaxID=2907623 RepID=UPI001F3864E2|nr:hypothetical protein [Sphingobacterium sp. SRCM116780]UIR57780.1 hypothetical protein LZQ00_08130 [Sphingobacterium sp. SRCM116780]
MSTIRLKINISNIELQEIEQNHQILLTKMSLDDMKQIQDTVFDSLTDKDGAPQVGDLFVSIFDMDNLKTKGRFRLTFNINRQFCCSDINSCKSDYIDLNFTYVNDQFEAVGSFMNWDMDN